MLKQEDIQRIERYISGSADEMEVASVEALFSRGQENNALLSHLEQDWESETQHEVPIGIDLTQMLDRVHHLIRNKENKQRNSAAQRVIQIYSRVAAILLLPLIVAGGLLISRFSQTTNNPTEQLASSVIHAPMGSRVSFQLPDGTKGWLNSGSNLTYTMPFADNRNVTLEGEGWFDVTRNESSPFEISIGNSKVKVLGTSFNVSAYPGEDYVEVVLQNGEVEFYDSDLNKKITMTPLERLVLRDGKFNLSTTDPAKYKAWTDGKLIFRGDDMAEVARRIERWYNVKVKLSDEEIKKFSFRATFEDDSLPEVLRLLSLTSPIGYSIAPRVVNSDGTFEKEIVTLYKINKNNNKQN